MKILSLFLLTYISCTLGQLSSWSGVASNVVLNDVFTSGWTECWSDVYTNNNTLVSDILNACSGDYIMYGCKQTSSSAFYIAAYAPREDVFAALGQGDYDTTTSNGVIWYFDDSWSMGFANDGDEIHRDECDVIDGDDRLCWHTKAGKTEFGYRCGSNYLNYDSTWSKYILHANNPFSTIDACVSDSDCTNGHGLCVSAYGGGSACSCLPGFGGNSLCNSRPPSCPYSPVLSNATNFRPSAAFSVNSDLFTFAVSANLEQTQFATPDIDDTLNSATGYSLETRILFGNGAATACDYPPGTSSKTWIHDPADVNCVDNWRLAIPWASAIADCGFSVTQANDDRTWSQTVTVSRKYHLPTLAGTPITRTESITKNLQVVFPTSVVVQTDVNVTGPVSVTVSAVVSSGYEPSIPAWVVVLKAVTNRPYKMSAPALTSLSGELSSPSRYLNYIAVSDVSACNNNDDDTCIQYITLRFKNCDAISGAVSLTAVPVCSGTVGATCASIPNGLVNFALSINNADSCAVINTIAFSASSLYSYSSAAFTAPQNQFRASDIAYFGAVIQSTNATLTSFTISSVCMQYNGGSCDPINYAVLSPASGFNPTFSVNMAQTRAYTQDTSVQGFVIYATIDVTWAEDSGSKRGTPQQARVNLNSVLAVSDEQVTSEEETSAANMASLSVFAIVMLLLAML